MNKTKIAAWVLLVVALLWTFVGPFLGGYGTVEVGIMLLLWVAVLATFVLLRRRRTAHD